MSGIFGLFHQDYRPVLRETLTHMGAAMPSGAQTAGTCWLNGPVGLGITRPHSSIPQDAPRGVALTAHGRLDKRDELWAILGQTDPLPNDETLILHAYLHWGETCVQHLLGDWAFAAWDARTQKLFLARDPCGISSLYYYHGPDFFAFASSLKALLALPEIPKRPNLFRIAQVLVSWPGDGVQTAYENLCQLPPAHTLTLPAPFTHPHTRQYWSLDNLPPLHLPSDEAYLETFLETYRTAVQTRLRGPSADAPAPLSATLSSGLDSGSVVALAAEALHARGERLLAFTAAPLYPLDGLLLPRRYGDETTLVECVRQFIPNLDVEIIRAETVSPLTGIQRSLDAHDSPMHAAGNYFWIDALLTQARAMGCEIVLTGQVGNSTISWRGSPPNFWSLLLSGQWQTLRRSAHGLSPWTVLRHYLLHPLRLQAARLTASFSAMRATPWAAYSALHPHTAQALHLKQRMKEAAHDPHFLPPRAPRQERLQIFSPGSSTIGATWAENGTAHGLEIRDPTMDQRLVELCFAIPDAQYQRNGQDRALIRRAMQGLLPDEVRLNRSRGLQAADLAPRIRAELPAWHAVMAQLENTSLARELLDLPKLHALLRTLERDSSTFTPHLTAQCGSVLTRGVMAGLFLTRF
ncbi:MAG: hypothetical protein H6636_04090 [Anaerolineales bacterium]|nr:hypothetical protein [Anaerolineales bacterium]